VTAALRPMSEEERLRAIVAKIGEFKPAVRADGGDLEFAAFDGYRVKVRLGGQCLGCALAMQTLGGIRRELMGVLDIPVIVVPCEE
jgi:NifU-like protein